MIWHLSCRQEHGDVENETIRIVPNMEQCEILAVFPIWDIYMWVTVVHIIIGHIIYMS